MKEQHILAPIFGYLFTRRLHRSQQDLRPDGTGQGCAGPPGLVTRLFNSQSLWLRGNYSLEAPSKMEWLGQTPYNIGCAESSSIFADDSVQLR